MSGFDITFNSQRFAEEQQWRGFDAETRALEGATAFNQQMAGMGLQQQALGLRQQYQQQALDLDRQKLEADIRIAAWQQQRQMAGMGLQQQALGMRQQYQQQVLDLDRQKLEADIRIAAWQQERQMNQARLNEMLALDELERSRVDALMKGEQLELMRLQKRQIEKELDPEESEQQAILKREREKWSYFDRNYEDALRQGFVRDPSKTGTGFRHDPEAARKELKELIEMARRPLVPNDARDIGAITNRLSLQHRIVKDRIDRLKAEIRLADEEEKKRLEKELEQAQQEEQRILQMAQSLFAPGQQGLPEAAQPTTTAAPEAAPEPQDPAETVQEAMRRVRTNVATAINRFMAQPLDASGTTIADRIKSNFKAHGIPMNRGSVTSFSLLVQRIADTLVVQGYDHDQAVQQAMIQAVHAVHMGDPDINAFLRQGANLKEEIK